MIIDQTTFNVTGNVITFPDYAFPPLPLPPSQVKETVVIQGNFSAGNAAITGSTDDPNN